MGREVTGRFGAERASLSQESAVAQVLQGSEALLGNFIEEEIAHRM